MGRKTRHALSMGIMGAIVGGLDFKKREWETQRAEEAEMRKQARLEQILIAREGRQEERDVAREQRGYEHDKSMQLDRQDHDAAMAALNADLDLRRLATAHGYDLSKLTMQHVQQLQQIQTQGAVTRENATHEAQTRAEHTTEKDGLYGSDGRFYPVGTPLPAGVTPAVGFGATNLGTRGTAGSLLGGPATRPGATAPRRDYSGFSIAD